MKYYYTDAQNRPTGPVELDQLRQLQAAGTIHAATSVIPEGATQWTTLGAVLGGTGAPSPATPPPAPAAAAAAGGATQFIDKVGTTLTVAVEGLLTFSRRTLSAAFLTGLFQMATRIGHIVVLVGAALGLIYSIVLAVRANEFGPFGLGLGLVIAIAVLQYIALRFFTAAAALVRTSPSRVGSAAVLDCLALVLIVLAVSALVTGTIGAIRTNQFLPFLVALVTCFLALVSAGVMLNPALSNARIEESSAGEEALGLLSFFAKSGLVALPVYFALFAVTGLLSIVFAFFSRDGANSFASLARELPFLPGGMYDGGMLGIALLAYACVLPLAAYLSFILYYLTLDVIRAILDVPRKLDRFAK